LLLTGLPFGLGDTVRDRVCVAIDTFSGFPTWYQRTIFGVGVTG
jgi:hypothetical protein